MIAFVISNALAILAAEKDRAFGAEDDVLQRVEKVLGADLVLCAPCRDQRSFVDEVLLVGARKSGRRRGQFAEVGIVCERDLACMNLVRGRRCSSLNRSLACRNRHASSPFRCIVSPLSKSLREAGRIGSTVRACKRPAWRSVRDDGQAARHPHGRQVNAAAGLIPRTPRILSQERRNGTPPAARRLCETRSLRPALRCPPASSCGAGSDAPSTSP
jgi:hypothetical protein